MLFKSPDSSPADEFSHSTRPGVWLPQSGLCLGWGGFLLLFLLLPSSPSSIFSSSPPISSASSSPRGRPSGPAPGNPEQQALLESPLTQEKGLASQRSPVFCVRFLRSKLWGLGRWSWGASQPWVGKAWAEKSLQFHSEQDSEQSDLNSLPSQKCCK